ncbi:family 10 glycosylhydrolase [Paenibacillus marinisediminis]
MNVPHQLRRKWLTAIIITSLFFTSVVNISAAASQSRSSNSDTTDIQINYEGPPEWMPQIEPDYSLELPVSSSSTVNNAFASNVMSSLLEDFEQTNHLSASSVRAVLGSVTLKTSTRPYPVMHGNQAVQLNYDFTGTTGTSAAYLNFKAQDGSIGVPMTDNPTQIGLWVYGDGQSHWLRALIQDATGAKATIDLTASRGLNWKGWRYITADLPANAAAPLRLNQIYVVETNDLNKNAGAILFDDIRTVSGSTNIYEVTIQGLKPMQLMESQTVRISAAKSGVAAPLDVSHQAQLISSHPDIVRVNQDGSLTAVSAGTASIQAVHQGIYSEPYQVNVTEVAPHLQSLKLYGLPSLEIGMINQTETFALYEGTTKPVKMLNDIKYTSSAPHIALIDPNGVVSALQSGETVIQAVYGASASSYTLQVTAPIPTLAEIKLSGLRAMHVGESLAAKVVGTYTSGDQKEITEAITFSSSAPSVAAIDSQGNVTALKVGVSLITATVDGKKDYTTLVVYESEAAPKRELRAAWIASVVNIDWPQAGVVTKEEQKKDFIDLLDQLKEIGMNAVVVQIKPTADAFYPSKYAPWSEWLTGEQGKDPGYDPLAFMVEEVHKRNMEFHAWFNPYRVSMQPDINKLVKDHPVRQNPDWVVSYGGKLYLNPGIPAVKQYVTDSIMEAVQLYDIDAVHFDDYFYPYKVAGVDFPDQQAFEQYGAGFSSKDEWRRNNVNTFVEQLSIKIKQAKPYVKFGISPFGVWRNKSTDPEGSDTSAGVQTYDDLYADTRLWVRKGWIDYVTPQIYWSFGFTPAAYEKVLDWWTNETKGTRTQLYVGHATYKVGTTGDPAWLNPEELPNQVNYLRSGKMADGSIYFSTKDVLANPLGSTDRLKQELYRTKALVPEMPWLNVAPPVAPKVLTALVDHQGVQLTWNGDLRDNNTYYVIYRAEGNEAPDITNPAFILDTVRPKAKQLNPIITYKDTAAERGKVYTYVITAVNRVHQESKPTPSATIMNEEIVKLILKGKTSMKIGETQQLSVVGITKSGTEVQMDDAVSFHTGENKVVDIDKNGAVTALRKGTSAIMARYGVMVSHPLVVRVSDK